MISQWAIPFGAYENARSSFHQFAWDACLGVGELSKSEGYGNALDACP